MKLWPDEYEAHRAEARAAANAAQEMMRLEVDDSGTTLERVRRMREGLAAMIPSLEGVEEREIAGVRCRIFRPEAAARGVE